MSFPLIGVAVAVLALNGLLSALGLRGPVPAWIAIAAAFATGYCALSVIAGDHVRLSTAEVLAFTTGLTILLTALSALAVSVVGIPITQFVVVFVGLPLGVVAYITRRPTVPRGYVIGFLRKWFDFSDYTRAERGIAAILLVSVAIALAVFISLAGLLYRDTSSMAIAVTGPNGGPIPSDFVRNVTQRVEVYVLANATPGADPFTIRIRLLPPGATGTEPFHPPLGTNPLRLDAFAEHRETNVSVPPGGTQRVPFDIALDIAGACTLRFELLSASEVPLSAAFLRLNETQS